MTDAINNLTVAEAEKIIGYTYNNNKPLFNKARELQNNLGLGGLWRDTEKVLALIITALTK